MSTLPSRALCDRCQQQPAVHHFTDIKLDMMRLCCSCMVKRGLIATSCPHCARLRDGAPSRRTYIGVDVLPPPWPLGRFTIPREQFAFSTDDEIKRFSFTMEYEHPEGWTFVLTGLRLALADDDHVHVVVAEKNCFAVRRRDVPARKGPSGARPEIDGRE